MKNNVEKYRKEKGMSQQELADESEVSRNTISNLERGLVTNVGYKTMNNISKALGKEVSEIFFKE